MVENTGQERETQLRWNTVRALADCYVRLPVEHFKMFDFAQIDGLVELGYRGETEALQAVPGTLPSV